MPWPDDLTPESRVKRARVIIDKQVDELCNLIAISESNQFIVYSGMLASQIPRSYAANAFAAFQHTSLNFEILRVCSLWDGPRRDRTSIPTLVRLIDDADCRSVIERDLGAEPRYNKMQMRRFDRALAASKKVQSSRIREALYGYRNRQLAHTLVYDQTTKPLTSPKYGYEKTLLRFSIAIVSNFNNAIRDSSFAFDEAFRMHRSNAEALWRGCTFKVLR